MFKMDTSDIKTAAVHLLAGIPYIGVQFFLREGLDPETFPWESVLSRMFHGDNMTDIVGIIADLSEEFTCLDKSKACISGNLTEFLFDAVVNEHDDGERSRKIYQLLGCFNNRYISIDYNLLFAKVRIYKDPAVTRKVLDALPRTEAWQHFAGLCAGAGLFAKVEDWDPLYFDYANFTEEAE